MPPVHVAAGCCSTNFAAIVGDAFGRQITPPRSAGSLRAILPDRLIPVGDTADFTLDAGTAGNVVTCT